MALSDGHFTYPCIILASNLIGNDSDLFWISKNQRSYMSKVHTNNFQGSTV